jgi:hypothetical protein
MQLGERESKGDVEGTAILATDPEKIPLLIQVRQ